MKNFLSTSLLILLVSITMGSSRIEVSKHPIDQDGWIDFNKNGKQDIYENPKLGTDERIRDLMSQMTWEEKVGQLLTPYGWPMYERKGNEIIITEELKKDVTQRHIGSLWGFMRADPWTARTLSTGRPS